MLNETAGLPVRWGRSWNDVGHERVIFVSYSHKDRRWAERLLVHLKPLERQLAVDVWDDSRIVPGTRWRGEIESALSRAAVAVLLVSADFLASDFVMNEEVPAILRNAETRGLQVLPLLIAPCLFGQSALNCFQSVNPLEFPLSKLSSHKRDEILVRLALSIEASLPKPGVFAAARGMTADGQPVPKPQVGSNLSAVMRQPMGEQLCG